MKKLGKTELLMASAVVIFSASSGSAYANNSVSNLNESLSQALSSSPEILYQRSEKEASEHKVDQSVGAYYPKLDVQAGYGREYTKQKYSTNVFQNNIDASETKTRFDPSVTLTQKIFDGMETPNDIKKSRRELTQSTKNLQEAEILAAFDVFDKYIAVRRFERLLKLANENVRVHQSVLAKIRKLVAAGKATSGDEKHVLSRLYDAKAAVGDVQGDLTAAYANFKEVVGVEAKNLAMPTFKTSLIPASPKEAVDTAMERNRSVIVAKATEDVAASDYDKSQAPFMPSFDFQLRAKKNKNTGGKDGYENNVTGQVIGSFNIFNGGQDIARRRQLRSKMASAKYKTQKELRRAEKEVRVSYGEMLSAKVQSTSLRGASSSKKQVRSIYMKQFDAGKRSFIDILDATHEYFLAKGSLITADATQDLASARLLASMGVLLDQYEGSF